MLVNLVLVFLYACSIEPSAQFLPFCFVLLGLFVCFLGWEVQGWGVLFVKTKVGFFSHSDHCVLLTGLRIVVVQVTNPKSLKFQSQLDFTMLIDVPRSEHYHIVEQETLITK